MKKTEIPANSHSRELSIHTTKMKKQVKSQIESQIEDKKAAHVQGDSTEFSIKKDTLGQDSHDALKIKLVNSTDELPNSSDPIHVAYRGSESSFKSVVSPKEHKIRKMSHNDGFTLYELKSQRIAPVWDGTYSKQIKMSGYGRKISNSGYEEADFFNTYYSQFLSKTGRAVYNGRDLYSMPKIKGKTFSEVMSAAKSPEDQIDILIAVATSLKRMHDMDLIHGDVHKHNFILRKDGAQWVSYPVDFGHTRKTGASTYVTSGGNGYGALWWSPDRKGYDPTGRKPSLPFRQPPAHSKQDLYSFFKICEDFYTLPGKEIKLNPEIKKKFQMLQEKSLEFEHSFSSFINQKLSMSEIILELKKIRKEIH